MAIARMQRVVRRLRQSAFEDRRDISDAELLAHYLAQRDEAAFAAIVHRHGPMVLSVCRRILRDPHDADDAFQATFLVLVRKADTIRPGGRIGPWLYGVACRTSMKANAMNLRRRAKQKTLVDVPGRTPPGPDDWLTLLDQEIDRLPEKFRLPIVLCDLEGKTRKQTARELGWPEGTVATRLQQGRALMQKRLARHGLPVVVGAVGLAWGQALSAAHVATPLVAATLKSASLYSAGTAAGAVSVKIIALVEGVLQAMVLNKVKHAAAYLVLVGLVALGAIGMNGGFGAVDAQEAAQAPPRAEKASATSEGSTFEKADGRLPTSPAPIQVLAKLDKDRVVIRSTTPAYFPRTVVDESGRRGTVYELIYSLQTTRYAMKEIEVCDTRQRRLDKKDLGKWLKEETPALLAFGVNEVDPLHLRLIKEGTLIFLVPGQPQPPSEYRVAPTLAAMTPQPQAGSSASASLPPPAPEASKTVPQLTPREEQADREMAIAEHYLKTGRQNAALFYLALVQQRFPTLPHAARARRLLDELRRLPQTPPPAGDDELRVGEIIIVGNKRVPDSIILDGLEIYPGQKFSSDDVAAAERRLRRLDALVNASPVVKLQVNVEAVPSGQNSKYRDILVQLNESLRLDVLAEMQKLEGAWEVASVRRERDRDMAPIVDGREMLFIGDEMVSKAKDHVARNRYTLDLSGDTKRIRVVPADSKREPQVTVGTYQLRGDLLILKVGLETKPWEHDAANAAEFVLKRKRSGDSDAKPSSNNSSNPAPNPQPINMRMDVSGRHIELMLPGHRIGISADEIYFTADGRVKLINAAVARPRPQNDEAREIVRGKQMYLQFAQPIRSLNDLGRYPLVNITSENLERIDPNGAAGEESSDPTQDQIDYKIENSTAKFVLNLPSKKLALSCDTLDIGPGGHVTLTNALVIRAQPVGRGAKEIIWGKTIKLRFDGPIRSWTDLHQRTLVEVIRDGPNTNVPTP